jgi:hypothetical protein
MLISAARPTYADCAAKAFLSGGTDRVCLRQRLTPPVVRLSRRLARRHPARWFLRLRELIVQFAVAHRSDQNVDD